MNIFVFDKDPELCARYHSDIHLSKMLIESCQLLCSVHHILGGHPEQAIPYKLTHKNHPCAKWVRESSANYKWLLHLAKELSLEYTYRKGCTHKSTEVVFWLINHTPNYKNLPSSLTPFVQVINEELYPDCVVEGDIYQSYKNYHRLYKQGFYRKIRGTEDKKYYPYTWTKRDKPLFMNTNNLKMKIKVVNKSAFQLPSYKTVMSSGMDLKADFTDLTSMTVEKGVINKMIDSSQQIKEVILQPQARVIIPTNLFLEIPQGYEAQIRPRSGQSIKKGFILPNSPGTIDADYRGNIGIIIANYTDKPISIEHGERIAQMVFAKVEYVEFEEAENLDETERGEGGFGHTGVK